MAFITIYRVQNAGGCGCYAERDHVKWADDFKVHDRDEIKYPNPMRENLVQYRHELKEGNWYCAFKDMVQLQSWFSDTELVKLKNLDFNIHEIVICESKVRIGEKQVIFQREIN